MSCFASKKTLTEKAGEYEKRGLSLFLALTLCLTLLPAAAFASGESETSAPHTHYLCGNGEACSYVGGHNETDKTTFATAIKQDNNGKVWVGGEPEEQPYQCALSEGTYYLATDLVLEAPSNTKVGCIQIMGNVTLCLNGHTITIIDDRDAFDIRKSVESNPPTLTLTDCKNSGQITHESSDAVGCGVKVIGSFTMYSGSITGNHNSDGGVRVEDTGSFIMYGGSITGNSVSGSGGGVFVSAQDGAQGSFAMYGATITATCINCAENNNTDFHGGSVTIAAPEAGTPTYDGSPKAAAMTVSNDWLGASADNIRITYKQGETTLSAAPTNAGTYTAGITVGEGEGAVTASVEYTIKKADLAAGDFTFTSPTGLTYNGSAKTAAVTTTKTGVGTVTVTYLKGEIQVAEPKDAGEYTVWYKVAGDSNHSDTTPESVGVTIAKAKVEIPAADPTQFTYSGKEQTYTLAASGLYTVEGNVRKSAGTHTVTVTLKDAENYVWSDNTATAKTFDFAIAEAQVTVTAKDKSAYTYDAAPDLSKPGLDKDYTVSGLIGEDKLTTAPTLAYDPATPDMTRTGDAAKIVASGASAGENYEITYVDGKLTLSVRPITSPTTTKTETIMNPDGSVTKAETKPDGMVTEITTNKDGSTTKTETRPDGSSKTEVKDASGSTGTVKTDENGQTTAETTLSSKAVEDAKKNGEAVKVPIEVEASRDSNTAPTVKVELPKNAGETEVEIPVSNVKPGTVAVLVHADGTEEIVKNSLPTEDGIQLTVNGSAIVKIVDNSKDFADTRSHWAKDAIDFVSARGLVNGISDTIYAPNNSTTRAQLWTILARQNDADLTGGSIWYEKAQNWAKDKGISDGADPNGTINRAQVATFLYNHTARQGAL